MLMFRQRLWICILLISTLTACNLSSGDDESGAQSESLSSEGVLSVLSANVTWQSTLVADAQPVKPGETIVTDGAGHALLNFFVGTEVEILPNTTLVIQSIQLAKDGTTEINLSQLAGETAHSVKLAAGSKSRYVLETPIANLTVRGTKFRVITGTTLKLEVTEGTVEALIKVTGQQVSVQAGQGLEVDANGIITGPFLLPAASPTPGPTSTAPPTLTPGPATPLPIQMPTISIPTQAPTIALPTFTPTATPTIAIPTAAPTLTPLPLILPAVTLRVVPTAVLTASFVAEPAQGVVPQRVHFTDTSTGEIIGWTWQFGDGGTSTDQHPWWTYTKPGTYQVTLTIYNRNKESASTTGTVIIARSAPK